MNNSTSEGMSNSQVFIELKNLLESKESPIDQIVFIITNYIIDNNLKYLFQPLSWFDRNITLDTASRRDDPGCDLCIQIRCMLSLACCCCVNYIRYPCLMSRYNAASYELYTGTHRNYSDHWKFLQFWNIDNLMKILGYRRKFVSSLTRVGRDDVTDGIDKIAYHILDNNIEIIKIRVYNSLVYKHFINGKIDEPETQIMCC